MTDTDKIIELKRIYKALNKFELVRVPEDEAIKKAKDNLWQAIALNYRIQYSIDLDKAMEDLHE